MGCARQTHQAHLVRRLKFNIVLQQIALYWIDELLANYCSRIIDVLTRCIDQTIFIMRTSDLLYWQQIIQGVIAQHKEAHGLDEAISLWESLAAQVISIVGEGGFNSLYSRSIFLTKPEFPWLDAVSRLQVSEQGFIELKECMENQDRALARTANSQLLVCFIGVVASIVGDKLTMNILRLAWGNEVMDTVNKELKNV